MQELIQYLQTLPIKPIMWVAGVLASIVLVIAISFVCVIFYRLLFPRKNRSWWDN